jgi:hypothetical protein
MIGSLLENRFAATHFERFVKAAEHYLRKRRPDRFTLRHKFIYFDLSLIFLRSRTIITEQGAL